MTIPNTFSNTVQTDELAWQAFRYVAEEMSSEERAAFEVSLENDLAACEALAHAVELTTSVAMVERFTPAKVQSAHAVAAQSYQRLTWLAAGVLAIAGLGLFVTRSGMFRSTADDKLAAAWSAVQTDWSTDVTDDANSTDEFEFAEAADVPVAPSWMLAAVRGIKNLDADADRGLDSAPGPLGNEIREN